jgi:hypothetical protein
MAVTLLVVCVFTAAQLAAAAAPLADCSSYAPHFPYPQSSSDCIMANMCYTRNFCCPSTNAADVSLCLDITTFKCNLTAACESHAGDASWYPFTTDSGLSVACCHDGYTTTQAPAVPSFDVSASTNLQESSNVGPLPARTCDDAQGCAVSNWFPTLIRAFCKEAIPSSYTDLYLVQSASNMCCKYAAAPSGSPNYTSVVGTAKCGLELLNLPRIGEFHCSMQGRAATICCNGRITHTASSGSGSTTSSTLGNNYTYLGNTCLYVQKHGDGVVFGGLSTVALVVVAAAMVMSAVL